MSPFVTVALLCLFGAAAAQDPSLDQVWESYKAEYKKDYPVAEEPIRWGAANVDAHYGDVIMGTVASKITILTIVYSTVYMGADQRKH